MWAANLLTVVRVPLGLLCWVVVDKLPLLFSVIGAAALSDFVDGRIARRAQRRIAAAGEVPPAGPGAWLDPMCDKFFVLSLLGAVFVNLRPPLILLGAIAAREIVLVPLATIYRFTPLLRSRLRYDFRAGPVGKAATVAQFIAIVALLLRHRSAHLFASAAAVIGLLAAAHYIARGVRLARTRPPADGPAA